jgi:hypothetical protein
MTMTALLQQALSGLEPLSAAAHLLDVLDDDAGIASLRRPRRRAMGACYDPRPCGDPRWSRCPHVRSRLGSLAMETLNPKRHEGRIFEFSL